MYQLTDNDAQLLAFINKTGPTEIARLQDKFSGIKTITLRLQTLTSRDVGFLSQKQIYHRDGAGELYREDSGINSLTPLGIKALEDYQYSRKLRIRDLWFKNAWLPILVSIAANLAIAGIRQLWPLIQQWLSHTPA